MRSTAEFVARELQDLKEIAGRATVQGLRDGTWLVEVLKTTVDDYAEVTDRTTLESLHPDLDDEALADARISDAQWRGALAGGTSAGAYASVVMASLATGVFVGAALPAAVTAFAIDLYYQARLQICLAWDLALIYRHELDLDRDEDLWVLIRVAFGVDDEEPPTTDLAKPTVPLASRFGTRALTTAARLATGVQAVGRTLALRSLAKFAIPAAGVPLCAGVNHITTGAVGRAARDIFRDRARGRAMAGDLERANELVTCAVLLLLHADQRLERPEVALLAGLAENLEEDPAAVDREALKLDEDQLVARISEAPDALKLAVWQAAVAAAELDGQVVAEEERLLAKLERACQPRGCES